MSAEVLVDSPDTVLNSGTFAGGNYVLPSDVFSPSAFEQALEATGASPSQAASVQDIFSSIGNHVTKFFGNLLLPSGVSDSNASSVGQKSVTISDTVPSGQDASPSSPSTENANSVGGQAYKFLNSPAGKIALTGTAASASVAGLSSALNFGSNQISQAAKTAVSGAENALGLPVGSLGGGLVILGAGLFILLLVVVLLK